MEIQITEWHSQNENCTEKASDSDVDSDGEMEIEDKQLKIYIFGKNRNGENVSVIVNGFPCFFYILLPHQWSRGGSLDTGRVKVFVLGLLSRLRRADKNSFIDYDICYRKKFRGFTNNKKFPFLRMSFNNSRSMRNCTELFIKKNTISGQLLSSNYKNGLTRLYTPKIRPKQLSIGDLLVLSTRGHQNELDTSEMPPIPRNPLEIVQISEMDGGEEEDGKLTEITIKGEYEIPSGLKINWTMTRKDGNTTMRKPINFIPGLMTNPSERVELYESNIDPMLRFLHIRNISPCGWIKVPLESEREPILTESEREYVVDWMEIKSITPPANNKIKTLAFDIECGSSHGDFPQAIKGYTKLSKQLLELQESQVNPEEITKILQTIFKEDYKDISRIYLKCKNKPPKPDTIKSLAREICRYLWLNITSNKYRLSGLQPELTEIIINEVLYLPGLSGDALVKELRQMCDIIPTLSIRPKTNFCGWKSDQDEKYVMSYLEDRDPTCYTEISLTALLDSKLPPLEGDRCIQIGACFMRQGEPESYRQVLLNFGTCETFSEEVEVITFPNNQKGEADLLNKFSELIIQENPDIITGYNTFSFDWPYLFDRAKELGILNNFSKISRLKDRKCQVQETNSKGAMGKFVEIPGRVNLDLFKVIQRDFNLPSYKLDSVSAEFIRGKVSKITKLSEYNAVVTTDNTIGLKPGNFIQFIVEKGYDIEFLNNGKKHEILEVTSREIIIDGVIKLPKEGKCLWCLGKDDISPQDIFKSQTGTSQDRAIIGKYCVMDVVLCLELMNKLQIINNNVGMANVCSTPLSWIFKRGQGIKILSLVSKECRDKKYLIPTLYPDTYGDDSYEGAIVLKPYPGIYLDDEPVSVLDYASLYPNSMRSNNLSHETLCTDQKWLGPEGEGLLKTLGYNWVDIEYDNYKGSKDKKVKTGICHVRFVQPKNGKVGIIPNILTDLLNARKSTRKKIIHVSLKKQDGEVVEGLEVKSDDQFTIIKNDEGLEITVTNSEIVEKNDRFTAFEKSVYDGLQLAYKVTANSLYGQIGAPTSAVYWKDIAAATTATGREQLYIAKDFIEENYPGSKIVYGDTDSVFVKFSMLDEEGQKLRGKAALQRSIDLGIEAGKRISKILKHPQDLEYEKTFMPFILLSKKRYVGNKYEEDTENYKQTSMGIVLKRRDNAMLLKVIYGGVIDIIMKQMKVGPAIDFLQIALRNLIKGKFGLDKLIITKTLNDGYKNPEAIAHNVLAKRIGEREPGNKPQLFDRIPFAYIQTKEKHPLQGDRIEHPDFIREHNLKPDYEFYITNQIMKPISQIFALAVDEIPTIRKNLDVYENLRKKCLGSGLCEEMTEKRILLQKQRDVADHLFADILIYCESQKNGDQNITKWFGS